MNSVMSKAAFARLCQVSQPMISKYAGDDRLVMVGAKVDVRKSLMALAGRLDEQKRRAALARLDAEEEIAPPAEKADDSVTPPEAPAASTVAAPLSDKARRDRIDADIKEAELGERLGRLVDVVDVRLAVEDTVATFWSEAERRLRQETDEIAAALKLSVEDAKILRRLLGQNSKRLRQDFSDAMQAASDQVAPKKKAAA